VGGRSSGMARQSELREYLYVSVQKVERLAAVLPQSVLQRLREVNLNAGPVGGGFVLADGAQHGVASVVGDVEAAVEKQYKVRSIDDPDLKVNHWVKADGLAMAYGIPTLSGPVGKSAAVFIGDAGASSVLLVGSAEYMLDRRVTKTDFGGGMSNPQAIDRLLLAAADDGQLQELRGKNAAYSRVEYPMHHLYDGLSRVGTFPLTFLARLTHVSSNDDGAGRNLIGTPLFIALAVPD
jgi:hypothetical protein